MSVKKELFRLLGSYTVSGADYNFDCPFCRGSHIHINFSKGAAICHGCGFVTRNLHYLVKTLGGTVDVSELGVILKFEELHNKLSEVIDPTMAVKTAQSFSLPSQFERLVLPFYDGYSAFMYAYLVGWRGASVYDITRLQVGFCRDGDYAGMLVFPVFMAGELVYCTSRRVLGAGLKSRHPPAEKSRLLYGIDSLMSNHVFVVEGVFDTLAFENQAVALFGSSMSQFQARLLGALSPDEITVVLDSDVILDKILKVCKLLQANTSAKISYIKLDYGDPFERRDEMDELVKTRVVYDYTYQFQNKLQNIGTQNENSRTIRSKFSNLSNINDRLSKFAEGSNHCNGK